MMLSGGVVHGGFQLIEGEPQMTITTRTSHPAVAIGTRRRHWTVELLSAVSRLIRHRRAAAQLLDMDDCKLADIGLSRSDVTRALNGSLLQDPTKELSSIAGRR
jgi:uncharacterized protein YjiS (DUF1127 family)